MFDEFQQTIMAAGLTPPDPIILGKTQRFPGLGKPKGNTAGWLHLFPDRRGGCFGDFSTGLYQVWSAHQDKPLTKAERQAFREQLERVRVEREAEIAEGHRQAAIKARKIWKRAIFADDGNEYLRRKKVSPHGTKTGASGNLGGVLIVPIYDGALKLVNLQFIQADGTKRFLSGGKKKGCFWWLGNESETVLIAEGFATAASLHESTGKEVFIAIDAGNLANVAKAVRAKKPHATLIIMGDNDLNGAGQKAARDAALACGGKYLIPAIAGYDWNDTVNAGLSL